jgi:hypothetical protein
MIDTVDSVAGDQLYFNPRILRPERRPLGRLAGRWARRLARTAISQIRRVTKVQAIP